MTTVNMSAEALELAQMLGLEPLPHEGGLFRQVYKDEHSTAIYFMVGGSEFSALHILNSVEVYHWYAGAPLKLLFLNPDGTIEEPVLGPDIAAGQRPQVVAPAGVWQGSSSTGEYTLVGTTMAPGFDWEGFELGNRAALSQTYPDAATRIAELTEES